MSDQRDDEDCIASFDSRESIFLAPDNSSTFHLGDEVNIRWYAGLLNGSAPGDESQSMEFNLILTTLQNSSYIFNLFQNTFLQFTKTPSDIEGITWSFTSTPDCPATEVSYNWTIPTTLPPFNAISDPDFIFIFESNQETGKASTQSPPFQIAFSPSPAPSSSSSPSSSAPDSGITQILPPLPTDSSSPTPSSPYILSPGTKVAIAIGSIIGGLLSIAFGAWLSYIFLSRRSRRRKDPTMTAAAADGSFSSKELAASPESEFMLTDARRESVISALPSPSPSPSPAPAPAPAPAQAEEKEFEIDSQPILSESGGSALFEMSSESRARARPLSASASALSSRVVAAPPTMEMAVETVFFELDASEPVQRRDSASMKLPG